MLAGNTQDALRRQAASHHPRFWLCGACHHGCVRTRTQGAQSGVSPVRTFMQQSVTMGETFLWHLGWLVRYLGCRDCYHSQLIGYFTFTSHIYCIITPLAAFFMHELTTFLAILLLQYCLRA